MKLPRPYRFSDPRSPKRGLFSRTRSKLRSERGAALSLALLLFLVCLVVGIIVLRAGTVTAGRYADLEAADQRYYSVKSAAELFRDTLSDQSITVKRQKITTTGYRTPYTVDTDGVSHRQPDELTVPSSYTRTYTLHTVDSLGDPVSLPLDSDGLTLLEEIARIAAVGYHDNYSAANDTGDVIWSAVCGRNDTYSQMLSLTHKDAVSGDAKPSLSVTVSETLRDDGTLVFTFTNADTSDGEYSISIWFSLDIPEDDYSVSESDSYGATYESGGITYTPFTHTMTENKVSTVVWSYQGMTTGGEWR